MDLIDRQAVIDTEGLDAQIKCEMCRNPMHTDRGCDGNCKYDEKLYERIMQMLCERIKPLPFAQPEQSDIKEMAVDIGYLRDWYQNSVLEDEWPDRYIEEVYYDFYLIPKQEGEQD